MKLFSLPIQWRTILKWKDFFKQSISFSKTFVDFQAKATERQIYISPFTFENNSDEVHITGCFGKRPETKYNGECLELERILYEKIQEYFKSGSRQRFFKYMIFWGNKQLA